MAMNGNSMGKDENTGFLEPKKNYNVHGFTGEAKAAFLALYKEKGNIVAAIEALGFDRRTLYNHLKQDKAFLMAFKEAAQSMENELSGIMFQNGKKGSFMHGIAWLRAHFPEKWGNKAIISHEKKSDTPGLLDGIDQTSIIEAEIITDDPSPPSQGNNQA